MHFLWSLFAPRQKYRSFARLDPQGRCQAFKHCKVPPMGDGATAGWKSRRFA